MTGINKQAAELENIASYYARRDFLREIQLIINMKVRIASMFLAPCIWTINNDGTIQISETEYPANIQKQLDKCDEIIEVIKEGYATDKSKRKYIIEARKFMDRKHYRQAHSPLSR